MAEALKNYIGDRWTESSGRETLPLINPATGESLGRVPLSTAGDVDAAVKAASNAFADWRRVPAVERARYLFRYKALLDEHRDELCEILTREHGKTLSESWGSLKRGIENVEHACGIPNLLMGESLEDVAGGIDTVTRRQPIGVFAGITPFNFPAMVPLWFWPYAVACGNTFVLKPSEQVPLSQARQFELMEEAGFPPGVLNLVHGAKEVVEAICEHPDISGVSFVGSTPVARLVYQEAAASGKRVQSLGGAKNFMVVMPDADLETTISGVVGSCYGCAGQRCLAGSTAVLVGDAYDTFLPKIVEATRALRLGNGLHEGVDMGPVISKTHRDRVLERIQNGIAEGANLVVDGREQTVPGHENGFWVGACLFDEVQPEMSIAKEEIFGPVLNVMRTDDLDSAVRLIQASEFANATSIFTTSGASARRFEYTSGVSMMGVNVGVAAPMAFFPFGGAKNSFFGDLKAHGRDSVRFYTDQKVVISRW